MAEPSRGTMAGTAYSVRCDHSRHTAMRLLSLHFLPSGRMAVLYIFFCGLSGGINFQRLNVVFMQWRFCAAELRCSIFSPVHKSTLNPAEHLFYRVQGAYFLHFYRICIFPNCNKHLVSRKFIPVAGRSHLCLYRVGIIFETFPTAAFRENLKIFYLSERGEFHDKTSPGVPEPDHQRQHHRSAQHQRSAR